MESWSILYMGLINSYLGTTRNLEDFFNALTTAQAPERFTQKFLESLEFKSSNDRLYISLLKGLGFLDENGIPLTRYYDFLDQTQSKRILAEAVKEAYGDLFAVKAKACELTTQEVKNKLKTLTQGKKTENVLHLMASTFRALCDYAEWSDEVKHKPEEPKQQHKAQDAEKIEATRKNIKNDLTTELHYDIQIHLPESRDQAVYDAIFKSLRDHLL